MTLLPTEAEALAAEQRVQAAFEAAHASKAAMATEQLALVASVSIEGHPKPQFNDVYTRDSAHKGWPVLKNDKGMYCYRYTPGDEWFLNTKFTPDEDVGAAYIEAKEGPLPVGAHTWRVWVTRGEWADCTLTVTLLPTQAE